MNSIFVTFGNKLKVNPDILLANDNLLIRANKKFKTHNKELSLKYMKDIVRNGEYVGLIKTCRGENGYKFKKGNDCVVLNEALTMFVETSVEDDSQKVNNNIIHIDDNISFNLNSLKITQHYRQRCKERFYITDNKLQDWFCREIIKKGKYIGLMESEDGNRVSYGFVKDNAVVLIDTSLDAILTTYKQDRVPVLIREKVANVIENGKKSCERKLKQIENRNRLWVKEINLEIAEFELKLEKTRLQQIKCYIKLQLKPGKS